MYAISSNYFLLFLPLPKHPPPFPFFFFSGLFLFCSYSVTMGVNAGELDLFPSTSSPQNHASPAHGILCSCLIDPTVVQDTVTIRSPSCVACLPILPMHIVGKVDSVYSVHMLWFSDRQFLCVRTLYF